MLSLTVFVNRYTAFGAMTALLVWLATTCLDLRDQRAELSSRIKDYEQKNRSLVAQNRACLKGSGRFDRGTLVECLQSGAC